LINKWIKEESVPPQTHRKEKWAHVASLTPEQQKKLYRKLDDESRRQRFRRAPPAHNTTENEMVGYCASTEA